MENIDITHYAPVIIPTLNRKQHLERCVDSLSNNTGADKTDLIISVDYPPSEKYVSGYKEVKEFLNKKWENKNKFKSVKIIYQKKNLGPSKNFWFLVDIVSQMGDTYISTEDDNEFSPNFLDFVNKGLNIFNDDPKIIGICANNANKYLTKEGDTIFASKLFPAYGVGMWISKNNKIKKYFKEYLIYPNKIGFDKLWAFRKQDRFMFNLYISAVLMGNKSPFYEEDELQLIDSTRSFYMNLTECFAVRPTLSLSRTWGNDGSGVNMPATQWDKNPANIDIDNKRTFEYVANNKEINNRNDYCIDDIYDYRNNYLDSKYMFESRNGSKLLANLKNDVIFLMLIIFNYDYLKLRKIKNKIKGLLNK